MFNTFKSLARDKYSDLYSFKSLDSDFKSGDLVYRVFQGPVGISGPHEVLSNENSNTCKITDYAYLIPVYQLRHVIPRPPHLVFDTPSIIPPLVDSHMPFSNLKVGDLVLYENMEDGIACYDVGKVLKCIESDLIQIELFFYDMRGRWSAWVDDTDTKYTKDIETSSIKASGFLLKNGRLPKIPNIDSEIVSF